MTETHPSSYLPDAFLAKMIDELDDESTQAIILHGSYVRGDALPVYSDVDIVRVLQETAVQYEQKRFIYRDGYLLSISSRPLSVYHTRFMRPETAIFAIPGIREARILLDKDGEFQKLQQEAWQWKWEPLQAAANTYASQVMVAQTEIVLKLLRAFALHDLIALSEMIIDLFAAVTDAVAVQRGVLVRSGNTYFHQVQESMGPQSAWTRSHLRIAGVVVPPLSLKERGKEALFLYEETARLLKPVISPEHWDVIERTIDTIKTAITW